MNASMDAILVVVRGVAPNATGRPDRVPGDEVMTRPPPDLHPDPQPGKTRLTRTIH